MPQSVWCRITRCPRGGRPWLSRPSRAHERSAAGVTRPPMLRITTPSPSSRPSTSPGSTRESTQPSTCKVSLVGNGSPANAPVAANAALRRTSSSEEMIMSGSLGVQPVQGCVGAVFPAAVDSQRVAAVLELLEFGDGGGAAVLLEGRAGGHVRDGVVLEAGDEQQGAAVLVGGVYGCLGVEGEVGCRGLEERAGGAGNRPFVV